MDKTIIREYEVYHRLMRDAQVYVGDSLETGIDLYDERNQENWKDFSGEPIIDIVFAKSEQEAVEQVARDTGYHESNLYAIEHVVDAKFAISRAEGSSACSEGSRKTAVSNNSSLREESTEFRFTASSYDDGRSSGIEILLPNNHRAFVCFDRMDSQIKVFVTEGESLNMVDDIQFIAWGHMQRGK